MNLVRLLGGLAGLGAAFWLARTPLQAVARWIVRLGDNELAQLLALGVAFGSAIVAVTVGLSPALAAFGAGMIISEGDARHIVEKEIRPFRDLLVGIFFVAIGTQISLSALPVVWDQVLLWLLVLVPLKGLVVMGLLRALGEPLDTAARTAAILAHGGEFGLLLVSVSLASGALPAAVGTPLLLALGISMLIASLLAARAARAGS
jgi:CPA2 family monovalent cation:H+ antiporter-2